MPFLQKVLSRDTVEFIKERETRRTRVREIMAERGLPMTFESPGYTATKIVQWYEAVQDNQSDSDDSNVLYDTSSGRACSLTSAHVSNVSPMNLETTKFSSFPLSCIEEDTENPLKYSFSLPELSEKQEIPHLKSSASCSSGHSSSHSNCTELTPPSIHLSAEQKKLYSNPSSQNKEYFPLPQVSQLGVDLFSDPIPEFYRSDSSDSMMSSPHIIIQEAVVTSYSCEPVASNSEHANPAPLSLENIPLSDNCPDPIPIVEEIKVSQAEPQNNEVVGDKKKAKKGNRFKRFCFASRTYTCCI